MIAKIWNTSVWIKETREKVLDSTFDQIIKESGFTVLGQLEHEFAPYGYTKLYLLGESHFAIHTFPEENKTYIELSSCNERFYCKFIDLIKQSGMDIIGA